MHTEMFNNKDVYQNKSTAIFDCREQKQWENQYVVMMVVYLISVYFYCSRRKPAISDRTKPQQFVFICKQFCFSLAEIYKHPHTWSLACKGENVSYWQKHSLLRCWFCFQKNCSSIIWNLCFRRNKGLILQWKIDLCVDYV